MNSLPLSDATVCGLGYFSRHLVNDLLKLSLIYHPGHQEAT